MKLLVEFNLNPNDEAHDVAELCVDIRDRVDSYLMGRKLSWDKTRVTEFRAVVEPKKPDWRVGLSCKPKYRHDDLWYERGIIVAVEPSGTAGLVDPSGILRIKMESGGVILRRADEWVTA